MWWQQEEVRAPEALLGLSIVVHGQPLRKPSTRNAAHSFKKFDGKKEGKEDDIEDGRDEENIFRV